MNRFQRHVFVVAVGAITASSTVGNVVAAEKFGTPAEAKAMLVKAAAAVKKDEAAALAAFTKGENGFKDRDLYPFCGDANGVFTAHPKLLGKNLLTLKDKSGSPVGEDIYAAAKEGKISEVSYQWPRPGSAEPVQKIGYVTKIGDQVCAVGFYK